MPKTQSRSGVNYFGQVINTEEEDNNLPEKRLWRAVLAQLMEDAFSNTISNKLKNEKLFARDYLRHMHKDFAQVCEWAGFEPGYVHLKVKKKIGSEFIERLNNLSLKVRSNNHGS